MSLKVFCLTQGMMMMVLAVHPEQKPCSLDSEYINGLKIQQLIELGSTLKIAEML